MSSLLLLDHNHIALAYSFLRECQDEEPRTFGVDLLSALPRRHGDGSFHQDVIAEEWSQVRVICTEDDLIEQLEGREESEESEESDDGEWVVRMAEQRSRYEECDGDEGGAAFRDEPVPSSRGYAPAAKGIGMGRSHARLSSRRRRLVGVAR